jgi:hypothetical protein
MIRLQIKISGWFNKTRSIRYRKWFTISHPHTRIRAARLFGMFMSTEMDSVNMWTQCRGHAGGYRRSNYITVISRSACSTNTDIQGPSLFTRRPRRLYSITKVSRFCTDTAVSPPPPQVTEVKLSRPNKRWSLTALVTWYDRTALKVQMGSNNIHAGFGTLLWGGLKVRCSHSKAEYLKRQHETSVQILLSTSVQILLSTSVQILLSTSVQILLSTSV